MNYMKRHAEYVLQKAAKDFKAILVTGARQVGKSTLLQRLHPDVPYITFDDTLLLEEARREPGLFFLNHPYPVTMDEVQYIQELFPYIKIACDRSDARGLFFLSGSQAFHLMKHVSESLAGRIFIFPLAGLSMREINGESFALPFIPTKQYIEDRGAHTVRHVDIWRYIHRGNYPELYAMDMDWYSFFSSYVQTYIQRDVNDLTKIKDRLRFTRYLTAMAARTGQMLNYSHVAAEADISVSTAKEWTSILEASGLIYILQPYYHSVLKRAIKTPKVYFRDTGLVCFLTRHHTAEQAMTGAMAGALFETHVVSEIIKSFSNHGLDYQMYVSYYRGKDKRASKESEIDLLIETEDTIYPIEIKMTANPKLSMTNSFDVLDRIPQKKRGTGVILCMYDNKLWLSEHVVALPIEYV